MNMKKEARERYIMRSVFICLFLTLVPAIVVGIAQFSFLDLTVPETAMMAALVGFFLGLALAVYLIEKYLKNEKGSTE